MIFEPNVVIEGTISRSIDLIHDENCIYYYYETEKYYTST